MARDTSTRNVRRRISDSEEPDLVGQYLAQIGSTPLLSATEEVELAKRIEAGVYAAELLRAADAGESTVDTDRRRDLEAVAHDGEAARDHMIRANLRLVVSAARKHSRRGLPFLDVVQEGNLGLIRAVEKFDYAKGFKFSTYAMWWIRQAIERGLAEQSRTVRLPAHVSEVVSKLGRIDRDLQRMLGRDPTVEEVADEAGLPVERVVELRRVSRDAVSLDTPIGDDGETSLGELIEDDDSVSAADIAEHHALLDELESLLATLPPREATIISLRFGLRDGRQHTLQEVAEQVGLTRERVRQLENTPSPSCVTRSGASLCSPGPAKPITAADVTPRSRRACAQGRRSPADCGSAAARNARRRSPLSEGRADGGVDCVQKLGRVPPGVRRPWPRRCRTARSRTLRARRGTALNASDELPDHPC